MVDVPQGGQDAPRSRAVEVSPFARAQVALFKAGISFVHLAPDPKRCSAAERAFNEAVVENCPEEWPLSWDSRYDCKFAVCTMNGQSFDHVPVLFIEDEQDCEPQALREALYIPAPINGAGPMVVRECKFPTYKICRKCGHRVGDHNGSCGCQHLEPAYSDKGYLLRHDKCECREGVVEDDRS